MKKILFLILTCSVFFACSSSDEGSSQEDEKQYLDSLFEQIQILSFSENCTDPAEWKFTAYGSKPCGGVQGYVAYSTKIDESFFLQQVSKYTEEEKKYNEKWGIVSDCAVVAMPTTVICRNNKPELIY